ncbi:MAG TPA: 3-hydroxyacyl-CoA dehydrogenase NAD-binding domain-containing protein [Clostridia bacterium]|nr:3-hydroxyacyl-CoA dehydrogenase NAD-binding domain-containing protein [Clostridia bacterium]
MLPQDLAGAVVGVVGAGTMGAGIAQVALEAGHEVVLHDVDAAALERGRRRIREGLARRAARLDLDADSIDEWVDGRLERLRDSLVLDALAGEATLIVEAALEDLELKRTIFRALDAGAPGDTILATNTSALSVGSIAEAAGRPERVVGLHFFNPAPLMPLVEVVRGSRTAEHVVMSSVALVERWGKTPVVCADAPGFIVNRVNRPFTLEALAILEAGEATVPQIDAALRTAGYPMGPFELMDLTGVDVSLATARGIHESCRAAGDSLADRFRPATLQERLVAAGRIGRKAGAGFYGYDATANEAPEIPGTSPLRPEAAAASGDLDPANRNRIVERIELAIVNEAYRALEAGVAGREPIDLALRLGAGHPEGPFERWQGRGGSEAIRARLAELQDLGPRFIPASTLTGRH